jgi:NAD(P)-dependent dehydrogenase (short-subunit alcohol dehydrogenase family)
MRIFYYRGGIMGKLDSRVALITGAASGFGRAAAMLFAKEGAKVVVNDINDQAGQKVVETIRKARGEASYVHADTGMVSEVEDMVKKAVAIYGKLNIFWHNAGVAGPGYILRVTEQAFDRCLAIHVKGGFFGAKYAIPEIKKAGGGSILFTSSIGGYRPSAGSPVYSMAKASLSILARCLAVQWAKDNIRVNVISPGPVKTGLWNDFMGRDPDLTSPEEYERKIMDMTPMRRHGQPEDIAQAALFLVSDEANFITGVTLAVDGGMLAT